jgi:ATP-binding cassette subfamily B protein
MKKFTRSAANADDFHLPSAARLPDGHFRRREGPSWRQKQLLIARAAAADPPVTILDEATSRRHADRIDRAGGMDALMQGRTVFVIAHRLSTIQNADDHADGARPTPNAAIMRN